MECLADECLRESCAKGLCSKHYQRMRATGITALRPKHVMTELRFWRQVDRTAPAGCWTWRGWLRNDGYANFRDGKTQLAHRWAYLHFVGPIPKGLCLDHICKVRHCVNPEHLEPVTIRTNTLRSATAPAAINARKTHCPKGHEYTPENTIGDDNRRRQCLQCQRERRK